MTGGWYTRLLGVGGGLRKGTEGGGREGLREEGGRVRKRHHTGSCGGGVTRKGRMKRGYIQVRWEWDKNPNSINMLRGQTESGVILRIRQPLIKISEQNCSRTSIWNNSGGLGPS